MSRAITWGLPLLTLAVYLYLVAVLGQQLSAEAGGQLPYDLRILGYDLATARGYLRALTPDGFALYQGPIRWTDTLFPALMGLCFLWWMRPFRGVFGMVCIMAAMSYVALDWGENMLIQRMLQAGPDWVRPTDIFAASAFTQGKAVAFVLSALLAIRATLRRRRG